MKRRWKLLLALAILAALLIASTVMSLRVRPAGDLDAYKTFLRDHGEKLELRQVLPPPVAPESNAVDAVQQAFALLDPDLKVPDAMKMVAPGKALTGWKQPEVRGDDFTNSWADFAADVEADRPALELLHQVLARPSLDFALDYSKGARLPLTHLASLKRSAQALSAAVMLDLHRGDTGAAVTNILTLLALVHHNTSEGLLISHLVRIALTAIAVAPTWELLQATNVTGTQLAAVQAGWQQLDLLSDAQNAFVMERAWASAEIQQFRAGGMGRAAFLTGSGGSPGSGWSWPPNWDDLTDSARSSVGEALWRSSWSYSDELYLLKTDQIVLEAVRAMQTNRAGYYQADYQAMSNRLSSVGGTARAGDAFFRALKIPDFREFVGYPLSASLRKTLRIEAACDIVVTAVTLKRYQLEHGVWPQTLAELVPAFLPKVPIDLYDGKPLRYHPNADGTFLLYCIGEDGVDNGGAAAGPSPDSTGLYWQSLKARDWVWPQPATPAEIQYFREH